MIDEIAYNSFRRMDPLPTDRDRLTRHEWMPLTCETYKYALFRHAYTMREIDMSSWMGISDDQVDKSLDDIYRRNDSCCIIL
jgi:hypothetical protein